MEHKTYEIYKVTVGNSTQIPTKPSLESVLEGPIDAQVRLFNSDKATKSQIRGEM